MGVFGPGGGEFTTFPGDFGPVHDFEVVNKKVHDLVHDFEVVNKKFTTWAHDFEVVNFLFTTSKS